MFGIPRSAREPIVLAVQAPQEGRATRVQPGVTQAQARPVGAPVAPWMRSTACRTAPEHAARNTQHDATVGGALATGVAGQLLCM